MSRSDTSCAAALTAAAMVGSSSASRVVGLGHAEHAWHAVVVHDGCADSGNIRQGLAGIERHPLGPHLLEFLSDQCPLIGIDEPVGKEGLPHLFGRKG